MSLPPRNLWMALALVGGLAYPPLVYIGLPKLPAAAFVGFGLVLMALRLAGMRRLTGASSWYLVFALAALALCGLLIGAPQLAAKSYPVIMSLAVAAVFALSLAFPPTVVARIARASEPQLSAAAIAYTSKVTAVWVAFLLANAAISAATALWGSVQQWTLWNGLLSYLAMGILFAAEFLVRRRVRR